MDNHSPQPLSLFLTGSYPCSYLPEQQARSQAVAQADYVDSQVYSQLMRYGFRRSGLYTYRPQCDQCKACVSVRIVVDEFTPNRTQRRLFKKHQQALYAYCLPDLSWHDEHYELYQRYQACRHPDNSEQTGPDEYIEFMLSSHVDTQLVEFRSEDNVLRMVSVFDILDDGLSAVYTFYDVDYIGSLGSYAIMWLNELCKRFGRPYLYLGYWVENSQKMNYKMNYQPLEYYFKGSWSRQKPSNLVNKVAPTVSEHV